MTWWHAYFSARLHGIYTWIEFTHQPYTNIWFKEVRAQ